MAYLLNAKNAKIQLVMTLHFPNVSDAGQIKNNVKYFVLNNLSQDKFNHLIKVEKLKQELLFNKYMNLQDNKKERQFRSLIFNLENQDAFNGVPNYEELIRSKPPL
jgi:Txe/YoeB family toxin of Txe-Axe toxin-antitoxin module